MKIGGIIWERPKGGRLLRLAGYLAAYRDAGCPPASHSEAYRAAYHPAYRVGLRSLLPEELRACGI